MPTFDADQAIDQLFREVYAENLKRRYKRSKKTRSVRRFSADDAESRLKRDFRAEAKRLLDECPWISADWIDSKVGHAAIVARLAVEHLEDPPKAAKGFLEELPDLTHRFMRAKVLGFLGAVNQHKGRFGRRQE